MHCHETIARKSWMLHILWSSSRPCRIIPHNDNCLTYKEVESNIYVQRTNIYIYKDNTEYTFLCK